MAPGSISEGWTGKTFAKRILGEDFSSGENKIKVHGRLTEREGGCDTRCKGDVLNADCTKDHGYAEKINASSFQHAGNGVNLKVPGWRSVEQFKELFKHSR